MNFYFNAFSVALLMSGVVDLLLSLLLFQRKHTAIKWFSVMMLCTAVWAITYSFELASDNLQQMSFWITLEYIGIAFIPAAWIIFVIKIIDKNEWLSFINYFLIFVFPSLTLLFVWTNDWHHLHYVSMDISNAGPFPLLDINPGPWYHVHTVYFYFMLAWGIYLLISKYKEADIIYKKQNGVILVGAFIPWVSNLIYLLGFRPYEHIDITPFAFIITCLVVGFGLFRYKLFDIVPLARAKVIENIREGMLVLDAHKRVIDINGTMKKFLFPDTNKIIGKYLLEILPHEVKLHQLINEQKEGKTEIKLPSSKGERFFEVSITVINEKKGVFSGMLMIFWEITERILTIQKLKQQADQLSAMNNVKNRLFSIIAHDLRGPLANLISLLRANEAGLISEKEFKSFIPLLSENVDSTSMMLDNLLHWSKSQLEGEAIHPERFDLKKLLTTQLSLFEKRAKDKKIILEDKVKKGTFLFADQNMIALVLRNLIGNAVKFCKKNDVITISCEVDPEDTTICISDTGVGMDENVLAKIFEPDIISQPGTMLERGTGLGLKLCMDFIEKNNGSLWVKSTLGKGSQFYSKLKTGKTV